jgi:hypothetical protein
VRRARTLLLGLAVVLSAAARASAQSSDPIAATELFKQARDAMAHGDNEAARLKLGESLRLDEKVGTLLNLADCEEKVGRIAAARQHVQRAIDLARAQADDRLALAQQRYVKLDARVPRLTVTLAAGASAGASVDRDGVALGPASLGAALPVEPGKHVVSVSAAGRATKAFDVTLAEGEHRAVEVAPGDAADAADVLPASTAMGATAAPGDATAAPSSSLRTVGLITAGAGLAAVAVGSVFGLMAIAKNNDSKSTCDAGNVCDPGGKSLRDQALTDGNASTVAFVIGAAAFATGVVLVLAAPGGHASASQSARLEAAPSVSPGAAGLTFRGAW